MIFEEDIVRETAASAGISLKIARNCLDTAMECIVDAVSDGERVVLTGFGTFERAHRAARVGRNPHTNEAVPIPERVVPVFVPGKIFKERASKVLPGSKKI